MNTQTFNRNYRITVFILLGGLLLLPRCVSTLPENPLNSTPSPGIVLTKPDATLPTTSIQTTQTRLPGVQSTLPLPSATFSPPTVSKSPTYTSSPFATPPPEPLPAGWLAFGSAGESINIVRTDGLGLKPLVGRGSIYDKIDFPDYPAFSPDGQWIAFGGAFLGVSDNHIYLVRSDGSKLKRLTYSSEYVTSYAWSPDGKTLVYSKIIGTGDRLQGANPNDLFTYDLNRVRILRLTNTPDVSEFLPTYSPDGNLIAHLTMASSGNETRYAFHIIPLDGSTQRVIEFPFSIADYAWSPDGSHIVMAAGHEPPKGFGCNDLYLANMDDGTFSRLTSDNQWYTSPVFSPDGKWIAFTKASCNAPAAPGFDKIGFIPLSGGQETFLPDYPEDVLSGVSWSPWPAMQTEKRFLVTPEGDGLKLRSEPSSNAQVHDWLQEGKVILVLDGPVETDGYLWWYVRVDDSEQEGWVAELPGWFKLP